MTDDDAHVRLGINQSAEPGKCGSCSFFRHRQSEYDTMGICHLKLPPWVEKKYGDPKQSWEVDPRTVRDVDDCSFHAPWKTSDGLPVIFAQTRTWKAGEPSK